MKEKIDILLNDLREQGYGVFINKTEYAEILGCSVSSIDKSIARGYGICSYKKLGKHKNARVRFALRDVAEHLISQEITTL